ncbi:ribosome recycling factor [Wolbachia endosymbiont of Pentidionis agamae]|uniref:ribosome recycling factor n=1 Tax=Wolbachia endosymbiont of Pentidionis agamae TaxID=3110435 RepID=UPI002FD1BAA5
MLDKIKIEAKERMLKTIQVFRDDIKGVRTGRANASFLDGIVVNIGDGRCKLNELASVSIINSKMLSVEVWDASSVNKIKDAILNSSLNLNPIVEGKVMRIPLPDMTEETRKKLIKLVQQFANTAHEAINNIRRTVIKELKNIEKGKKISKDDCSRYEKEIEKITEENHNMIDKILSTKEKDILHN